MLHTAVNGAWCLCKDGQFTLTATVDPPLVAALTWINRELVPLRHAAAAFGGGRISSDGGAMLLGLAERRIGIADRLAAEITDRRDPTRVVHALSDILRARILAIACGYEDADDLDHLRSDPALKLACGHLRYSWRIILTALAGVVVAILIY